MLHQPELGKWCGPSALSILSNEPYPTTTSLLAFIRDQPYSEISGVYTGEMILALGTMGFTATPVDLGARYDKCPTLQRYMRERPATEKVEPTLISIYRHFIVGHYDFLADSWEPKPTHFTEFPKPRRFVEDVHIIRRRIS